MTGRMLAPDLGQIVTRLAADGVYTCRRFAASHAANMSGMSMECVDPIGVGRIAGDGPVGVTGERLATNGGRRK